MLDLSNYKFSRLGYIIKDWSYQIIIILILSLLGMVFLGPFLTILFGIIFFVMGGMTYYDPHFLMKHYYKARAIEFYEFPQTFKIGRYLGNHIGLPNNPKLYLIPTWEKNAFALGCREDPAIGISQGLIETMNERELKAILAHEMAHLETDDTLKIRFLGNVFSFSSFLMLVTNIMLVLFFPLIVMGMVKINVFPLLLLWLAPIALRLASLAKLRNKEFYADLRASYFTKDPEGLANALEKVKKDGLRHLDLILPTETRRQSIFFSTHPSIDERIQKLSGLTKTPEGLWSKFLIKNFLE